MGKGVVADSHPANASAARSATLRMADVVIILRARLNWIFHYGGAPKRNPLDKFIQVDISPEEMGRNAANAEYSLLGNANVVVEQGNWVYDPLSSDYIRHFELTR
jgi:2-hydroxyacyl-CoA lyase 1